MVITVSEDGQSVVWKVEASGNISILCQGILLENAAAENDDVILSADVDDKFLFLGSLLGQISVYSLAPVMHDKGDTPSNPTLVKSFVGFQIENQECQRFVSQSLEL